jgi:Sporulation delaying protein SdpA
LRTDPSDEARRGFAFTLTALSVAVTILAVTYLPEGLVGPAIRARQEVAILVLPLRWGFYTESVDAEYTVAYRVRDGGFEPLMPPNVEHSWGLDRAGHGDVVRLTSTAAEIPASAWRDCAASAVRDCASVLAAATPVRVASRLPQACGRFVFTVEDPAAGPSRRIRRVASVELTC